jgi:hypothetical protein
MNNNKIYYINSTIPRDSLAEGRLFEIFISTW